MSRIRRARSDSATAREILSVCRAFHRAGGEPQQGTENGSLFGRNRGALAIRETCARQMHLKVVLTRSRRPGWFVNGLGSEGGPHGDEDCEHPEPTSVARAPPPGS